VPVFKPGQQVQYKGESRTVHYVLLRHSELRVFLNGVENSVNPDELAVQPTEFVYTRNRP
jgi:hypothetical protein